MSAQTWENRKNQLNDLYSPSAPINSEKLFYGRKEQLNKIHEAVDERGLHIVLYGERGVGKTSMANILTVSL
jgi:replication-associated recombination protein RarA